MSPSAAGADTGSMVVRRSTRLSLRGPREATRSEVLSDSDGDAVSKDDDFVDNKRRRGGGRQVCYMGLRRSSLCTLISESPHTPVSRRSGISSLTLSASHVIL